MADGTSWRKLLEWVGASAALLPIPRWARSRDLEPKPACGEDEATPSETAGPFYKPRSPHRASLIEPRDAARQMRLSGHVLTTRCKPIAGALIDIWHADARGRYDLQGFRYRGHLFTDAQGAYDIATIVPGIYEGRTRHIQPTFRAERPTRGTAFSNAPCLCTRRPMLHSSQPPSTLSCACERALSHEN